MTQNPPRPRPKYRSTKHLAKLLGVSEATARRYCASGRVKARRTLGGGPWRITDEECQRAEREMRPVPPAAVVPASVSARLGRMGIG